MDQYNQPGTEGTIPLPTVKPVTKTAIEREVDQLKEIVAIQQRELQKLHRDINRLKNSVDDVINLLQNRG